VRPPDEQAPDQQTQGDQRGQQDGDQDRGEVCLQVQAGQHREPGDGLAGGPVAFVQPFLRERQFPQQRLVLERGQPRRPHRTRRQLIPDRAVDLPDDQVAEACLDRGKDLRAEKAHADRDEVAHDLPPGRRFPSAPRGRRDRRQQLAREIDVRQDQHGGCRMHEPE
jgi:hypothetical protein